MKRVCKRAFLAIVSAILLVTFLFLPGTPWAAKCRHVVSKLVVKANIKVARWRGIEPKFATLKGRVRANPLQDRTLTGARIEALDSRSGWATLTDAAGDFQLPDVLWYPGGNYALIVSLGAGQVKRVGVHLPASLPDDAVIDLGDLYFESGCEVNLDFLQGANSLNRLHYDTDNHSYYKDRFSEITASQDTDDAKFAAINRYVASRLKPVKWERKSDSPRQTLEDGSSYCGDLTLAFATLARAGGYKARLLDLRESATEPTTHMVIEVYYDDGWHLFDPGLDIAYLDVSGRVSSYKELTLHPELMERFLSQARQKTALHLSGEAMQSVYKSGMHHFYSFEEGTRYTLW